MTLSAGHDERPFVFIFVAGGAHLRPGSNLKGRHLQPAVFPRSVALDARDRLMLSFQPEPGVPAMVEHHVLFAPPARYRVAQIALCLELSAVGVLVAVRAGFMLLPEGRHVQQAVIP